MTSCSRASTAGSCQPPVAPAKAGAQWASPQPDWIPACAGMTMKVCGNDAYAGMTLWVRRTDAGCDGLTLCRTDAATD